MASERGLDAFLASRGSGGARGRGGGGRQRRRESDWAGEDEGEGDDGGGSDANAAAALGRPSAALSDSDADDADDSGADDEDAENAEGSGQSPAVAAAGQKPSRPPRTRDWERIHGERWRSQQGMDAEADDGAAAAAPAMAFRSSRKRERAGSSADANAREEEEEAERQHRMRALFDRREGERLEAFTMQSQQPQQRQATAAVGVAADGDEDENEGDGLQRRTDPWWLEQRAAAKAAERVADSAAAPSALLPMPSVARPPPPPRPPSFALHPWSERDAKRLLLRLLRPGESALTALRRLGAPPAPSSSSTIAGRPRLQTKQKNQRTRPSAGGHAQLEHDRAQVDRRMAVEPESGAAEGKAERERAALFSTLTDLCAQAVEEGWLDVYQVTWQQLQAEQRHWPPEEGEHAAEPLPAEDEEFVTKASADAPSVQGPFTARELIDAVRSGEVAIAGVVRPVGATAWMPLQSLGWLGQG